MGPLRRCVTALANTRPNARGFATNVNQTFGAPAETFKRKVRGGFGETQTKGDVHVWIGLMCSTERGAWDV